MKGRRIFSAVLLVILLMCGGSDSGFFVYAEDSDSLSATETQIDDNKEENIEKEEHTDTQKECNKSKKSDDEQSIDKKEEKPEDRQQEDIEIGRAHV